jgi:hypothetical protein
MTDLLNPYERVTVGHYSDGRAMVTDRRVVEMLELTEHQTGIDVVYTQGSYNTAVSASGGTHAGGGVVDLRVIQYTDTQRNRLLAGLRTVGFISWYRTPDQGDWPYHIHIVDKGNDQLSPAAQNQVTAANAGRNGLKSNLYDGLNLNVTEFDWQEYLTMLTDIINRLAVVEAQVGPNTDARAQYAYGQVQSTGPEGNLYDRVNLIDGRVTANTDARAQYAYTASLTAESDIAGLQTATADLGTKLDALTADEAALKDRVAVLEAAPKA